VLLLDEPLAALDPSLRAEVREAIAALAQREGAGMLLVTHDLEEAGLLADRVALLDGGRLQQIATPAELFGAPATLAVARFLGVADELPGTVDGAGRFTSALGVLLDAPGVVGAAVAVLLPGALRVSDGGVAAAVRAHRHRPRGSSAAVALDAAPGVLLDLTTDGALPAVGTRVTVTVDRSRVRVFAAEG
jgi:putative spermidine/putrescine transport system ATP-binding protein